MARLASGLAKLRDQIDELYPNRDKSSDGWIGDAAHQGRKSEHNPDAEGVVRAVDITAKGIPAAEIVEQLRQSKDPRVWYIIYNKQISNQKINAGAWRPYTGSNPHTQHFHVSTVSDDAISDGTQPWAIGGHIPVVMPAKPGLQKGITTTIFSSEDDGRNGAYGDWLSPDLMYASLPATVPRGKQIKVTGPAGSIVLPVLDKGPWNVNDAYWEYNRRPQAESGTDSQGRTTNKAGLDISPSAAEAIGIHGKGVVDWEWYEPDPIHPAPEIEQGTPSIQVGQTPNLGNIFNVFNNAMQLNALLAQVDFKKLTIEDWTSAGIVALKQLIDPAQPSRSLVVVNQPTPVTQGANMPVSTTQIMVFVRWLLTSGPLAALLLKKSIDPNAAISVIEWILGVGIPMASQIWAQLRSTAGELAKKAAAVPGVAITVAPNAPASVQAVAADPTIPNVQPKR